MIINIGFIVFFKYLLNKYLFIRYDSVLFCFDLLKGNFVKFFFFFNFFIVNFDKFLDKESGIFGYIWVVGKDVCGIDIVFYFNLYVYLFS